MKKLFLTAALAAAGVMGLSAADVPLWLRDVAISPDGTAIAFTYKGDIYTVPVAGGRATQLTTDRVAIDGIPVWTPDGSRIAFRSNREGSADIFIMPAKGGTPVRLTDQPTAETPLTFLDSETLLFQGSGEGSPLSQRFPSGSLYTLNINKPGERPAYFGSTPMIYASADGKGQILYSDRKGVENIWRKHERAESTNDIWLIDKNGKHTKLTDFNGHDRNPVWTGAGSYAYVSEKDGTLNVYARTADGSEKQLTKFTKHPVRDLSAASNGTLAFDWDGEIYTLTPGSQPQKVAVEIVGDAYDSDHLKRYVTSGVTNYAVSSKGDQVAFIIRGELYVTDTKYKTTKRITDTAGQERCMDFSPDGRTLVYDSERDGIWGIYTATIKNPDEKSFAYATEIEEKPLYIPKTAAQQPDFSPDGKKVAFLENRTELRVIDMDSKKVTTALPGKFNYSYQDCDVSFQWSPDSRWLLTDYIGIGGWNNKDIALVKADGSEVVDLTESGYADGDAQWVMGGKGIAYTSGKDGYKSHGSWGNTLDVYVMFLDPDGWDAFKMTEEEAALAEKAKEDEKKEDSDKDKKGKESKKADADKKEEVKPLEFDLPNRRYRMARITPQSGAIGDYFISPKGDKIYYTAGATEGGRNLYVTNLKKGETKVLSQSVGYGLRADSKGETLFAIGEGGSIRKITLSDGKVENVDFEALYDRHPSKEREYMYDHMVNQVKHKFHDVNMHGTDWDYYADHYRKFLPHINNNPDFGLLLSEILGELNASHTGGSGSPESPNAKAHLSPAWLGAYFDEAWTGEGLKVKELIPRSPLSAKSALVKPGEVIIAIDGETIAPRANYSAMLEGKAGKRTMLTVKGTDGKVRKVYVKPWSNGELSDARYQRWVERNEAIVDSISGGKIGYVHIAGMNDPSFRVLYDRALGKYRNCDAIVVDTRHNGGGWLHNDVALMLSGKEYVRYTPRGQYIGSDPFSQWTKPSVMLIDESNYSDAHGTPYVYKTLGLGKLVGAPVAGTMTAVWWETQIDPAVYFGIPQVTSIAVKDGTVLENQELRPDIEVYNDPADLEAGRDAQLEAAVKELLKQTASKR